MIIGIGENFLLMLGIERGMADRMSVNGTYRGHKIKCIKDVWYYCDTGTPVKKQPDRACGYCGRPNTPEGHDGCLGKLPGVQNACCGHGNLKEAYVQFNT